MSRHFYKLFSLTLLLIISACSRHFVYVSAAVDPTYSPAKDDSIFVTLSNDPTIQERQLLKILKDELCRNGFNLVQNVEASKWTMGLSYERQTYQFGSNSSAVVIPGNIPIAIGSSRPNIVTDSKAYLYLFKSDSYSSSHPTRVWEGEASANDVVFQKYRPVIFKNLLDAFGKNLEGPKKLSKSYLYEAGPCAAIATTTSAP